MYTYISFVEPVALGSLAGSSSWSQDKHGGKIEVVELPGGGFLFKDEHNIVRRVAASNIAYVQYSKEASDRVWASATKGSK